MRKFDYAFIQKQLITKSVFDYGMEINTINQKAKDRKEEFIPVFSELESIAKIASIKTSNAIEGIVTSDERINALVNGFSKPLNHDEKEILGYSDALNYIHENHDKLSINEDLILQLHAMLMKYKNDNYAGKYKTIDNVIVHVDKLGNRSIRFTPLSASETPKAMEQLILAFQDAISNANCNFLLLIPCFILDFLCIHPFIDGNGRMSRLLTILLLYKAGYNVVKYVSFEEQINLFKKDYYETLRLSSENWNDNKNDYIPFIENFIFTLYRCFKELDKRFNMINSNKVSKSKRIELAVLNSLIPISKKEICDILLDVSPTTIEYVLGQLKKQGKIKTIGVGRSTRYIKQ